MTTCPAIGLGCDGRLWSWPLWYLMLLSRCRERSHYGARDHRGPIREGDHSRGAGSWHQLTAEISGAQSMATGEVVEYAGVVDPGGNEAAADGAPPGRGSHWPVHETSWAARKAWRVAAVDPDVSRRRARWDADEAFAPGPRGSRSRRRPFEVLTASTSGDPRTAFPSSASWSVSPASPGSGSGRPAQHVHRALVGRQHVFRSRAAANALPTRRPPSGPLRLALVAAADRDVYLGQHPD